VEIDFSRRDAEMPRKNMGRFDGLRVAPPILRGSCLRVGLEIPLVMTNAGSEGKRAGIVKGKPKDGDKLFIVATIVERNFQGRILDSGSDKPEPSVLGIRPKPNA
jgi:hypothetical protein